MIECGMIGIIIAYIAFGVYIAVLAKRESVVKYWVIAMPIMWLPLVLAVGMDSVLNKIKLAIKKGCKP